MIDEALLLILAPCCMTSMELQLSSAQRLVRRVQLPDEQTMSITTLCDRTQASGLLVTDSGVVVVFQ
jgi:hypothetical protein